MKESVYVESVIVKSSIGNSTLSSDRKVLSVYEPDNTDPIIKFKSVKLDTQTLVSYTKTYSSLSDLKDRNGLAVSDSDNTDSLMEGISWIALGEYTKNPTRKEYYFVVKNKRELSDISSHYNLPYPLPNESSFVNFVTSFFEDSYSLSNVLMGSVTFDGDTPTRLKAYLFEEDVSS